MKGLSTELKVGTFAILVLVLLSFMTFKVGSLDFLKKKDGYVVSAIFKNIAGLDKKTKVKVAGVDAGVIEKIVLTKGLARIDIRMDRDVKLFSDARASIRATGLLGDKYVDLVVGETEPALKDGDTIRSIQDIMDVDDLVRNLTNVSSSLNRLLVKLNDSLTDKDIRMVKEIVENFRDASGNLKTLLSENDKRLRQSFDNMNGLLASLKELAEQNKESLRDSMENFRDTMENFRIFSESLSKDGPKVVENLVQATGRFEELADSTSAAMKSLSSIANKVERGEGTLGKIMTDDRLYESVTDAVESIDRAITKIDRFKTYIQFRTDYLSGVKQTKGEFFLTLKPTRDKYYLLGIIGDPVGLVEITERDTNGVRLREKKIEKGLEFTAHFARRYKNTAFRLGLTESTVGVGADQFFLDDTLKLSFDVWDFNDREDEAEHPHLRLGADYFIFKNMFLSGGYDNFLNQHWRGVYFGAGVMFEDDDFKYILGSIPSIPGN